MIAYIKLSTLEYPRYEGNIRLEHPEITEDQTYPNFPCPPTYAEVAQPKPPEIDTTTQYLTQTNPVNNNGVWTVEWVINNFNDEELASIKAMQEEFMKKHQNGNLYDNLNNSGSAPNAI